MKKLTYIICVLLILLVPSTYATSVKSIEEGILKKCEEQSVYQFWLGQTTSDFYYCSLEQLINFNRFLGKYKSGSVDDVRMEKIIKKYWEDEYGTANWRKVMEEYEAGEGEGN